MTGQFSVAVTGQSLIKHDIRNIDAAGFKAVQNILRKADLSFTNFESTILGDQGGWPLKGSFFGCSQPTVLDALADTGFGALALSNNHAFDLGPPGILATLDEVERRGMLHAGIGRDHRQAAQAGRRVVGKKHVAMVAMDGGPGPDLMYAADGDDRRPARPGINRLKLSQLIEVDDRAFEDLTVFRDKVGYTAIDLSNDSQPNDPPFVDPIDELALGRTIFKRAGRFGRNVRIDQSDMERNLREIASAANEGYLVVAYLHHHHWASDWYTVPDWVGFVARSCIDAGAAMFLSHGAPVLQPLEIYNGRPIFYSLGNFIFHVPSKSTWHAPEVWESVIGICNFDNDRRLTGIDFHPVVIGGEEGLSHSRLEERLAPHLATNERAARILTRFQEQSAELGTMIEIKNDVGILRL
ncbi:CapA family protein [Agrobacterium sp. SORGH_AS 787]|uniref:CapA family protein n=1 Tax=Agrobacterium sp. SORGH_AS 787 TaxID=3041775 RepID=UPI00278AD6E0|nr:poly-gamma-glutamate capsule biosynthesis protein CapA/YwtB (metallophosphatase superfamily) [Rhizobium sp. SORGH_AS_0787]